MKKGTAIMIMKNKVYLVWGGLAKLGFELRATPARQNTTT
jgi:hypothetical protein